MTIKHVHLSALGGMAGDMFIAAMLDALPGFRDPVIKAVQSVLPPDSNPVLATGKSGGLSAQRFSITDSAEKAAVGYPALAGRICKAKLEESTRTLAAQMLRQLAEAEAAVHGVPLEKVHFHEIADWDTLADLVAAGTIIAQLGSAGWSLDPLPLGNGRVKTSHGPLQVPAPATARLLQGLPVFDDGIAGERVTPTGAVIAREIWTRATPRPDGQLGPAGYGAGTREIEGIANVLVAQLIETAGQIGAGEDTVSVMEFDVDDMSGEEIAIACDHLRETTGVIDLTTYTANGKKGRVATIFRLLANPQHEEAVAAACFLQTSTLGLRRRRETRLVLSREIERGRLRVKKAQRPNGMVTRKVEADDIAPEETLAIRRAKARGVET